MDLCRRGPWEGEGRECGKHMSSNITGKRRTEAPDLLALIRWYPQVAKISQPPCIYVAHLSLRTLCLINRVFNDLRVLGRALNGLALMGTQTRHLPIGVPFHALNLSSMRGAGFKGW